MESKIANPQSVKIAQRLRTLRESAGLNPEQLSRAIYEKSGVKIGRNSIINYEVGESYNTKTDKNLGMRSEYVIAFADFYGVSTDYILCLTDIPNIDTNMQAVHKFTGLSAGAISKLQDIYEKNRKTAFSDIISLLIEDSNAEYYLSIIGELISCSIEGTGEEKISVGVAGSEMRLPKEKMLKTIFQTSFIDALPRIVSEYGRQFDKTPNQRTGEYFELLLTLRRKKDSGEITDQGFKDLEETWMRGGNL